MAYATMGYGTEAPQSIDRFGTEQAYGVFARNGSKTDYYRITPQCDGLPHTCRAKLMTKARSVHGESVRPCAGNTPHRSSET